MLDEPALTQRLMFEKARSHCLVLALYKERLFVCRPSSGNAIQLSYLFRRTNMYPPRNRRRRPHSLQRAPRIRAHLRTLPHPGSTPYPLTTVDRTHALLQHELSP